MVKETILIYLYEQTIYCIKLLKTMKTIERLRSKLDVLIVENYLPCGDLMEKAINNLKELLKGK